MKVYSIIREKEYERLSEQTLNGSVLDLGGNIKSEYHALIKGDHSITSVNIDAAHGCDMVFDIQKPFPIGNASYDAVLSMNVFEHIFGFHNAFSESSRVLKKGGTFIFAVPFMHHIHGCPDDYFRYSKSTLEKLLLTNHFTDIRIREIGSGLFSLMYQSYAGVLPTIAKPVFKKASLGIDGLLFKISKKYRNLAERIPLGYFVTAKKI